MLTHSPDVADERPPTDGGSAQDSAPSSASAHHHRHPSLSGYVVETPQPSSSRASSPLLSELPHSPSQQLSQRPVSATGAAAGGGARPRNGRTPRASSSGGQDHFHVVVRLKPTPKGAAEDEAMPFRIETGPQRTPRTARRPGTSNHTPRTARATLDGSPRSVASGSFGPSAVPRTARTPTQSRHSPRVACPQGAGATGKVLTMVCPTSGGAEESRAYEFGDVLAPSTTDEDMCERLVPGVMEQFLAGYNTCVLCYGQTGSGKTRSISALAPAVTGALFDSLAGHDTIVELSYIQLYKEKAYNLLGRSTDRLPYGVPLPQPMGKVVCEPKTLVSSAADVQGRIAAAQRYRCTSAHQLNAHSSRSHTLLSLHVTRYVNAVPVLTTKVTLADLAGSERVKRTGAQGEELAEAIAINKSLHALHSLVRATAGDAERLPYRESLLTRYLAPRLREWHILLIVTAALDKSSAAETKSSLEFGLTARRCVVTKRKPRAADRVSDTAPVPTDAADVRGRLGATVEALRQRVADLQLELAEMRAERMRGAAAVARIANIERLCERYEAMRRETEEDFHALGSSSAGTDSRGASPLLPEEGSAPTSAQALELLQTLRSLRTAAQTAAADAMSVHAPAAGGDSGDDDGDDDGDGGDGEPTDGVVDRLKEAFLWAEARQDYLLEQLLVQERAMEMLRADLAASREERQALVAQRAEAEAREAAAVRAMRTAQRLQREAEEGVAALVAPLTQGAVRAEMALLYGTATTGPSSPLLPYDSDAAFDAGSGRWVMMPGAGGGGSGGDGARPSEDHKDAAERQEEILHNMTTELAGQGRSLQDRQQELDQCTRLLRSLWLVATPAQKRSVMEGDAPSPDPAAVPGRRPPPPAAASTGDGLTQGVQLVRLQARLQELERELSFARAKEGDTRRENDEQRRQIASLQSKVARMAESVVGIGAMRDMYLQAIDEGATARSRLVELVNSQQEQIQELTREQDRAAQRASSLAHERERLAVTAGNLRAYAERLERVQEAEDAASRARIRELEHAARIRKDATSLQIRQLEERVRVLLEQQARSKGSDQAAAARQAQRSSALRLARGGGDGGGFSGPTTVMRPSVRTSAFPRSAFLSSTDTGALHTGDGGGSSRRPSAAAHRLGSNGNGANAFFEGSATTAHSSNRFTTESGSTAQPGATPKTPRRTTSTRRPQSKGKFSKRPKVKVKRSK